MTFAISRSIQVSATDPPRRSSGRHRYWRRVAINTLILSTMLQGCSARKGQSPIILMGLGFTIATAVQTTQSDRRSNRVGVENLRKRTGPRVSKQTTSRRSRSFSFRQFDRETVRWIVARETVNPAHRLRHSARVELSPRLSLRRAKTGVQSLRQPTRSIGEVENSEGFTRTIEVRREASFRLANHRLQPLGHLTAARNLSIRQASSYDTLRGRKLCLKLSPPARKTRHGTAPSACPGD